MGGKPRARPGVLLWASRGEGDVGACLWDTEPERKHDAAGYRWWAGTGYVGRLYGPAGAVVPSGQCRRVRVTVELLEADDAP